MMLQTEKGFSSNKPSFFNLRPREMTKPQSSAVQPRTTLMVERVLQIMALLLATKDKWFRLPCLTLNPRKEWWQCRNNLTKSSKVCPQTSEWQVPIPNIWRPVWLQSQHTQTVFSSTSPCKILPLHLGLQTLRGVRPLAKEAPRIIQICIRCKSNSFMLDLNLSIISSHRLASSRRQPWKTTRSLKQQQKWCKPSRQTTTRWKARRLSGITSMLSTMAVKDFRPRSAVVQ